MVNRPLESNLRAQLIKISDIVKAEAYNNKPSKEIIRWLLDELRMLKANVEKDML